MRLLYTVFCWLSLLLWMGCGKEKTITKPLFVRLNPETTGIDFQNNLESTTEFNVYTYRNFYNGGGVAIGDINNDGLMDVYFTSNQKSNKLYLNKGDFKFEDITDEAGVGGQKAWSTGVTMADVNGDGLLDIYVCNSGDIKGDNKQNELFINQGDLTFKEEATAYGLDDKGFSTHASFFDFDKDGDLDVYILNNSYQSIASFNLTKNERPKRDVLGGDKLMENQDGKFVDISEQANIYGSIIGFGLGVTVGDVNNDNWDDIYVSNDFFERDYLYINQKDGTFKEVLTDKVKSTSAASMGADMADINNDGLNDIFVTDMLPHDYERLKSVTTFENWDRYQYAVKNDYYHQFSRNTLQLNTGDKFQELSRLANVHASDWSWGALIFDFDRDGYKDLFIANGIYQDLTDQDYLQYISNEEVARAIISKEGVDYKKLIDLIPSNPVANRAFLNKKDLQFDDVSKTIGLGDEGFSNGSVYADLDNDGDLDLIVNNVNTDAWVYENKANELNKGYFLAFNLKGEKKNTYALGTKIKITNSKGSFYAHQQPIRGFQSSVDPRPLVGIPDDEPVTVEVYWPSGKYTKLEQVQVDQFLTLREADATQDNTDAQKVEKLVTPRENQFNYKHIENDYVDFDRDRLMYHMISTQGPKLSTAYLNEDNIPDFYLPGAKNQAGALYISHAKGYQRVELDKADKICEDTDSKFFDADGDGDLDLYICSGGNEFSTSSSALYDRLYINEGKGKFVKSSQILPVSGKFLSTSAVESVDLDGDGDLDLFVGERVRPNHYGEPCNGFILQNDKGVFSDITEKVCPELKAIGMITDASWADIDKDGDADLIVIGEFMGIRIFLNENGFLKPLNTKLDNLKGWWNTLHLADLDGDGNQDLIVGNHGLNSYFKASDESPISLFLNDFDKNGSLDPILCQHLQDGKAYPYGLRHDLIDQIKPLKKVVPDYKSFKNASMEELFTKEVMKGAEEYTITELRSMIVWNNGNLDFEIAFLPKQAQLSPIYAINSGDINHDGKIDIIMGGNLYGSKPEVGRYDASYGVLLLNDGNRMFQSSLDNYGLEVDGEIRDIHVFPEQLIFARNNDSLVQFSY